MSAYQQNTQCNYYNHKLEPYVIYVVYNPDDDEVVSKFLKIYQNSSIEHAFKLKKTIKIPILTPNFEFFTEN